MSEAERATYDQLMNELINAIGVQVSFYYVLACIACVCYYRKVILTGWRQVELREDARHMLFHRAL